MLLSHRGPEKLSQFSPCPNELFPPDAFSQDGVAPPLSEEVLSSQAWGHRNLPADLGSVFEYERGYPSCSSLELAGCAAPEQREENEGRVCWSDRHPVPTVFYARRGKEGWWYTNEDPKKPLVQRAKGSTLTAESGPWLHL